MNFPEDARVEPATPAYVPQIASLARSYSFQQMSADRASEVGFLVSGFGEAQYRDFVHRANYFYVLVEKTTVLGFVLAYTSDRIQSDEWLNLLIKARHPGPFLLIKQVCVREDMVGRALATRLYQHLFEQVPGLPSFAAVVVEPANLRSIGFHEKLGFTKAFEAMCPDGLRRGVWKRVLR